MESNETKVVKITDAVDKVFFTDELSLSAKGLYMSILLGYTDIDFDNPEYKTAFSELYGKNYVDFKLN